MQNPLSSELPSSSENNCPDCLYMKLKAMIVESPKNLWTKLRQESKETEQIELYLTINFNEQWENLPGGRVKFGLRGGELRLKLEVGNIPYEYRGLNDPFEIAVPTDREQKEGNERQRLIEAALAKGEPTIKAIFSFNKKNEQTDKIQFTTYQVTTKGSEENPAWVFEVKTGEPVLKGSLNNALLGTMNVTAKPCHVKAIFEVSKQDVYLTQAEGLWPQDISRNKLAILERTMALWLLKKKLTPYISQVELHYE
ncbi:MAG: hypothetical protein F6K41_21220 [Symploca sp. SIO3E6]|nr:hypothetical protein [Caldora sp. SIO3E6]